MATNKRLEMLEKLARAGNADSFGLYALAMEYRKEDRPSDAMTTFETLRARDPEYLPMYLMAGTLLTDMGRSADARAWLELGILLATKNGDAKARSELNSALDACD
jgi:predicted Zn-dependent protease